MTPEQISERVLERVYSIMGPKPINFASKVELIVRVVLEMQKEGVVI